MHRAVDFFMDEKVRRSEWAEMKTEMIVRLKQLQYFRNEIFTISIACLC